MELERLDAALIRRGLFTTRAKAQEAIKAGLVRVNGVETRKSSAPVEFDCTLEAEAPYPWVSRGGVKLESALTAFKRNPSGARALDIGASTGGFTDALLSYGAQSVLCVDVGHGQLHERLRQDPRVRSLEKTDARSLTVSLIGDAPDWIVCDVSFISLEKILPTVLALAAPSATLIALVKPQFEAGPAALKKGVVRDPQARAAVCARIATCVEALGWRMIDIIPSPIKGGDGNEEFLLGAERS